MKKITSLLIMASAYYNIMAQDTALQKIPFDGMDLSWINGQNRQKNFPLVINDKDGKTVLTATVLVDGYFNYNFAKPKDNTQTISASTARSNEFSINQATIGIESNYKNATGRLLLQTGSQLAIVQETDGSVARGRNTSTNNLRYIREAAAGYHFDVSYGLNIELGIFMSYIGLESYLLQENWSYQRSMVCELTPFYFQGARVQYFPSAKYKTELWILNGWQSYNSWSKNPGIGMSNYYRPNENLQLVANFYYGTDSRSTTNELSDVKRFHHDNSIVYRYYKNKKRAAGISQAGFSLNTHYGMQSGDGVKASENFMTGFSLANRIWFAQNKLALTLRGDYVTNPGGYLSFYPAATAASPNDYDIAIASGKDLRMTQFTSTFDIMPNDHITFRLEFDHRNTNMPYFAGKGGTTSQTGFVTDVTDPLWKPDLVKTENRIIFSMNFRL